MRIDVVRTGGVAGLRRASSIASDMLPEHDARELMRLVEASRFFDLPGRIEQAMADNASADTGNDRFRYAITIDDGSRSHTVEVAEAAVPAALGPLIAWLTAAARRGDKK